MKCFLFLLLLSSSVLASVDESSQHSMGEKLPKKTFDRIITLFETTFSPLAAANQRTLIFMTDYDSDWIQAFARRWEEDQVIVYGGAAAVTNGSEDTFALILCHETGHLYGGRPWGEDHNKLSVEGQADYWASSVCFKSILPSLSPRIPSQTSLFLCQGQSMCARSIDAFLALTAQFADNRSLPHPRLDTPDETVVSTLQFTHPSPQCRLDTFMAGLHNLPRPLCWFKP